MGINNVMENIFWADFWLIWKLMRGREKLSTAISKKPFLLACTYLQGVHLQYTVACTIFQLQ